MLGGRAGVDAGWAGEGVGWWKAGGEAGVGVMCGLGAGNGLAPPVPRCHMPAGCAMLLKHAARQPAHLPLHPAPPRPADIYGPQTAAVVNVKIRVAPSEGGGSDACSGDGKNGTRRFALNWRIPSW